jgi:hypothetical protein
MHAIAIELGGEIGAVVHDEGDAAVPRDRLQDAGRAPDRTVIHVLQPELEAGNIAAGERLLQLFRKTVGIERRRRDQIQSRRRPRLVTLYGNQSFP